MSQRFTRSEQKIFDALDARRGEVVSRYDLMQALQRESESNLIDAFIKNIRKKLPANLVIETVPRAGYCLESRSSIIEY